MVYENSRRVLEALSLMSENFVDGVSYNAFVKQNTNVMFGVRELLKQKYAEKIKIGLDDYNYRLTTKGKKFLDKLLKPVMKEFLE